MPGAFWASWPLWAKMCFVLACSMVTVVCLGFLKRWYNNWELRKYTALDATRTELEKALEHRDSVKSRKAKEIPFGIRALESGIEVEGIWISKPNTPSSSLPSSPQASADVVSSSSKSRTRPDRKSDTYNVPDIVIPPPILGQTGLNHARPITSSRSSSSFLEPPRRFPEHRTRTGSPTREAVSRGRKSYQTRANSHLRYSDPQTLGDDRNIVQVGGRTYCFSGNGEGQEYQFRRNPEIRVQSPGNDRQLNASDVNRNVPVNAYQPQSSHPPQHAVSATPSDAGSSVQDRRANLDALATHRRSHAAETGQLVPRTRRSRTSGEMPPSTPATSLRQFRECSGQKTRSAYSGEDGDSIELQVRDPPARYSFESPLVCMSPDPTSAETKATSTPLMADVDGVNLDGTQGALQGVNGNNQSRQPQELGFPNTTVENEYHNTPMVAGHTNDYIVLRNSQQDVMRTVNPGFEILKPGTLDRPRQSSDTIASTPNSTSSIKRYSKKLQKKRSESIKGRDSLSGDLV